MEQPNFHLARRVRVPLDEPPLVDGLARDLLYLADTIALPVGRLLGARLEESAGGVMHQGEGVGLVFFHDPELSVIIAILRVHLLRRPGDHLITWPRHGMVQEKSALIHIEVPLRAFLPDSVDTVVLMLQLLHTFHRRRQGWRCRGGTLNTAAQQLRGMDRWRGEDNANRADQNNEGGRHPSSGSHRLRRLAEGAPPARRLRSSSAGGRQARAA
mmetsp:Transcript_72662/g.210364  ORF Transcript_72662/g.210364 Transcript_72662/m.210364 type:complete len:214 (+) Transcript_72662:779-1420(+)